jgi:xanthine dehydrogenase YagS FAD-binding subunit
MKPFGYERALQPLLATAVVAASPNAKYIGGGTNLLDLMKLQIETPRHLVDVSRLPLSMIEATMGGGLRIGATATNSAVAADSRVRAHYPMLAQALLAGASAQIRNRATVAGNLLQRTRCFYFYDRGMPCNKRTPGAGCAALQGYNRIHAVLGASKRCVATHPSDMAVAMTALGATIETLSSTGQQGSIGIGDLYRLPGETPHLETTLEPGELITAVLLPAPLPGVQLYRKVRDRASYAFALVSVAAALDVHGGVVRSARFALGGVAAKPWRVAEAEGALVGSAANRTSFESAAAIALQGARGLQHNAFKIDLAKRTLIACLGRAAGLREA